ncbi:MAG: hypothetical protein K2J11_03405 [Oscillospiraceae bacterium]|nr:hypothetical protein [Oscillospiraceae bacterium]
MTVVIPHPFHRSERYAPAGAGRDFAVCGRRPKAPPLDFASWAQLDQLMSAASPPKNTHDSALNLNLLPLLTN